MSAASSSRARLHLLAWVLVGLLLRAMRVAARWDELTLAYAAYAEPVVDALAHGRVLTAATTWVGLHPPLWALMHGASELLLPVPLLWLAGSALASLGAVVLVGRAGGPVAAAVLATSPLQLADAAEVNNYPLATFLLALGLAMARAPWPWLALVLVAASWSHVLAAAGAAGLLAWRLLHPRAPGERPRLLAAVVLGVLPVVVGALRRVGQAGTFDQPEGALSAWLTMAGEATGPAGLLLSALVLVGLRGPAAATWLPVAGLLLITLLLGAAAPHQRPYLALLGPAAAVAVAQGLARLRPHLPRPMGPTLVAVVLLFCGMRGAAVAVIGIQRLQAVAADQQRPRALDVALADSRPGDTIWIVVPALEADDDKTATGPLMWRLRPWRAMPIARPVAFEYTDFRYGQPRLYDGRTVHSSTELHPRTFDHVAAAALAQGRLWVVLADHGPATGLVERVERALRPYTWTGEDVGEDVGLGVDRLYRVEGVAP